MKKVFFVVMLLLGLGIFCSCDKIESGGISSSYLEGAWICINEGNGPDEQLEYFEFSKNGIVSGYELCSDGTSPYYEIFYASFKNGTLYAPAGHWWEKSGSTGYRIEGDELIFSIFSGKIKKLDKDTFVYDCFSGSLCRLDGTLHRIKKFSTE